MSDENPDKMGAAHSQPSGSYGVGYGKPPKEHQIKKGERRNPAGRPRKVHPAVTPAPSGLSEMQKLWLEEAEAPLTFRQNGKLQTITAAQAVILSLRKKAIEGGIMAIRTYQANIAEAQAAARELEAAGFEGMVEYKLQAEAEIRRRKAAGKSIDDILPHPDDVIVDPRTGFHAMMGPVDERERAAYADDLQMIEQLQAEISRLAAMHANVSKRKKATVLEVWHNLQAAYDRHNDMLPPSMQRKLKDRSMAPGATKAGDFFQYTPERIEALQRPKRRRKT